MCPELRDNPPTIDFLSKHVSLKDLNFQALAGDASTRRYVRVYNENGSFILMIFPIAEQKMGHSFLDIQKLFIANEILAPAVIGTDFQLGYILLEDLGDLTLERRFWENQDKSKAMNFYLKAVDEIIKVHSIPVDKKNPAPCFHIEFDTEKLLWEMNYMRKNLLNEFFGLNLSDDFQQRLTQDFTKLCDHLSHLPQVVCHRDYHSRNIMLHKNETYLIDFQDARLGPCQYDMVSLLRDSYVNLDAKMEDELLSYYFGRTKHLHNETWDVFLKNYNLQILQRALKACGSFSSFYNAKRDTRYIKYIQPTLRKVEKIMAQTEGFTALKSLFTDLKISEKNAAPEIASK